MTEQVDVQQQLGYYVYGIVPADAEVPPVRGLDDAELQLVSHGALAAAVSRLSLDRPPGRRAELLAHSHVVEALARSGPVVPVQFGSVLEHDVAAVEELLAVQQQAAAAALDRLRGKVQLNLRVTYVADQVLAEVVQEHPHVAELRRRTRALPEGAVHPDLVRLGEEVARVVESKRQHDAAGVLDALGVLVVDVEEREGGGLDHVLDVALLVEEAKVAELEDLLEQMAEQHHERMRFRLVGPVPAYDFTGSSSWV